MKFDVFFRSIIWMIFACLFVAQTSAQTQFERPFHDYKTTYSVEDNYSIIYDNVVQFAKLKEFRLKFYDAEGRLLKETQTRTYPVGAQAETYSLSETISGFQVVELSIISLHSGLEPDFPSNIHSVLGLTLKQPQADIAEPLPTFTNTEKACLQKVATDIDGVLEKLNLKTLPFEAIAADRLGKKERISLVLSQTGALSEEARTADPHNLLPETNSLYGDLLGAKNDLENNSELAEKQSELNALKTSLTNLRAQMAEILSLSESEGPDIPGIMSSVSAIEAELGALDKSLDAISLPETVSEAQISTWEAAYLSMKARHNAPVRPRFDWRVLLAAVLIGLLLLGLASKMTLEAKAKIRPLKSALHGPENAGVIFPASPMLAGNAAAPLVPTGQLAAAQLQMLSGPFAVLKQAYQATGRIGYAQYGVPSAEDYAFGTGFLVSDRHVLTNRHVHGLYGHYLLDEADPGGIEFIAEKDKEASDFVPFNGEAPLLLPALDIAIYTLARPVKKRTPIHLNPVETEQLLARDVVIIGYPDTHNPTDPEVLAVVEDDPIFAVKRLSQGQIFRHSTDTDTPLGVETSVAESNASKFLMPAICHNASTMGGNSGSPLLDLKTGDLVGVHFAGFKIFNQQEAANLAMAIEQLTESAELKSISDVTTITDHKTDKA